MLMELEEIIEGYSKMLHIGKDHPKYAKLVMLCKAVYYKEITIYDFEKNLSQLMEWQCYSTNLQ